MIFVDTSVWYSAHVVEDAEHSECRALLLSSTTEFVTTDYVVDELITLLVKRRHRHVAVLLGANLWAERYCKLVWVTQEDVAAAWIVFSSFQDKTWSFTDCVSFAMMKRLGIREAFSLDDDFGQFGFVTVRP